MESVWLNFFNKNNRTNYIIVLRRKINDKYTLNSEVYSNAQKNKVSKIKLCLSITRLSTYYYKQQNLSLFKYDAFVHFLYSLISFLLL